jgi:protein TonB
MYTKATIPRSKTKITLMETLAKNVKSLDDLVFENRNKSYGAYAIRKGYNNSMAKAFGSTALLLMLLLFMATRKPEAKDLILVKPPIPPTDFPKEVIPVEIDKDKLTADAGKKDPSNSASRTVDEFDPFGTKEVRTDIILKGPIGPVDKPGEDKGFYMDDVIGGGDGEDTTGNGKGKGLVPNDKPVYIVQEMPSFPGGEPAMMKFIAAQAAKNNQWADMGLTGTVHVQFIVNSDGSISNVQALTGNYDVLKKVAVNAVKAMPKWKPGMQDKRAVPVILVVPISFKQI